MTDHGELSLRAGGKSVRVAIALSALAAIAAGVAAGLGVAQADTWGILSGAIAVATVTGALTLLGRRVEAGPAGLRFRTVLRWHRLEWDEIVHFEEVRVDSSDPRNRSTHLRVAAKLRGGAVVFLPVPYLDTAEAPPFEEQVAQLRALRRRYSRGTPAQ
ncbi:hypothetical protein DIZ27_42650 [Streptomyces sp. NWU339]|uniref:hypothetical protein n=1 Tax=Streptomyces sp. NWU339 TaxID=2185284 RepID=UPI000D67880E|nr:hypothetical protein [Streptomyces sp. NWU339]PWI04883.1 hypothetical protein DIZ27_42650 [Streptomyces sp. NWU339]